MNDTQRTAGTEDSGFSLVAISWPLRGVCAATIVALMLAGCGGSGTAATTDSLAQYNPRSDADLSGLQLLDSQPGVSPFIQRLSVRLNAPLSLTAVEFTIQPKPGSVSKAVD